MCGSVYSLLQYFLLVFGSMVYYSAGARHLDSACSLLVLFASVDRPPVYDYFASNKKDLAYHLTQSPESLF